MTQQEFNLDTCSQCAGCYRCHHWANGGEHACQNECGKCVNGNQFDGEERRECWEDQCERSGAWKNKRPLAPRTPIRSKKNYPITSISRERRFMNSKLAMLGKGVGGMILMAFMFWGTAVLMALAGPR